MYKEFAGVILAGGEASRLGFSKEKLTFNGKRIIDIILEKFAKLFDEILIITDDKNRFVDYKEIKVIEDIIKERGPLAAIYTGLKSISKDKGFFVACDMPFLNKALITKQIRYFNNTRCDALVPRIGTNLEPLHAIYKKNLQDKLSLFIKESKNYSISNFLRTINVNYWYLEATPINRRAFKNINSEVDLKTLKR